jgi:hypothetical protein
MEPHQKDSYQPVILPVDYTRSFLSFNTDEIAKYYEWFLSIKSSRVNLLCNYLFKKDPEECFTETNLAVIECFLQNSVSVDFKPKAQQAQERNQIANNLRPHVKIDDYIFDSKTISICYDIGIFMGELIIRIDDKIHWRLERDDDFADYGQPVLAKNGCALQINPFRVAKNAAAKIYEDRYEDGQMFSFFNAWKKGFKVLD